ncbi:MAG: molybdopterin cofactor synthesis protein MoaA [uncultured bacterium]|nr:MAG: molybdopterin cofactor synthesis protein MoaA [uncultured bacterium]
MPRGIYDLVIYNHGVKKLAASILRSGWFVNNPVYNFFYRRRMHDQMKKYEKIPFRVMVENTNICNSKCTFCPHETMKRPKGFMDKRLFEKVAKECKKLGIEYFTIYGFGEPLLDKDFVKKVEFAKKLGLKRVTTNTNGELLTKDLSEKLINAGLDEIYISFDAATDAAYRKVRPILSFQKTEKNIRDLMALKQKLGTDKPEVTLSFVESNTNRHEVKKYIKKWKDVVDNISISIIHNWTGKITSQMSNKKNLRRDPCRLLWMDMVISWNGDVPLCCNDYENKVILGNIKNESIPKIWNGKLLRLTRKEHIDGNYSVNKICNQCEYNFHYKSPWWIGK